MEMQENYLINTKSLALLPKYNEMGELATIVLEEAAYYEVGAKPTELMEKCLRYFGSSMRAAKESVKDLIGNMYLAPVVIQPLHLLVWMPTKSIKDEMCGWINTFGIVDCRSISKNRCEVLLLNGHTIELDISHKKLLKQLLLAYAVMAILYIRLQHMEYNKQRARKVFRCKLKHNQLGYEVLEKKDSPNS